MVAEYNENPDRSLPPGAIDLTPAPEPVAEPVVVNPAGRTTHEEAEGVMIIASPSGKGERQIAASQWPRYASGEREWVIKHSNYVGPHHSDAY